MKTLLCRFLIPGLMVFSISPIAGASDWIIVPGKRVGPITCNTSEQDLIRQFGVKNVKQATIVVDNEGGTEPGTILFPEVPSKIAYVRWKNPDERDTPLSVSIINKGTRWKTDKGITIGTSLKRLNRLNQRPFLMAGFGFDGSGCIIHCNGGRLTEMGEKPQEGKTREEKVLGLSLEPDEKMLSTPEYERVIGDKTFSSDNPAMIKLNPRVYQMICIFSSGK